MARRDGTPYDPHAPHPFLSRKNMRWKGYDYARSADYFVTVVCHDRRNFLGRIEDDQVVLSPAGEMVDKAIDAMIDRYDDSELLGKVVMPNHIHLVIGKYEEHVPLSEMMAWLKGVSTHYCNIGVRQEGWVPIEIHCGKGAITTMWCATNGRGIYPPIHHGESCTLVSRAPQPGLQASR